MKAWILGIWLGVIGGIDFKYKEIPIWISIVGAIFGIGFCIIEKRTLESVFFALIPGVLAIVFSKLTKEVMGVGDGITFIIMGFFLSLEHLLSVGMLAFAMAGVIAFFLLVVFRKRGNYRMPFLPFLAVAYYLIKLGG